MCVLRLQRYRSFAGADIAHIQVDEAVGQGASRDHPQDDYAVRSDCPLGECMLIISCTLFAQDPNTPGMVGLVGSSDPGLLEPPPSANPPFTPVRATPPWGFQSPWMEALHHRAAFLFNLKNDPRFLSFLPVFFPIPPSSRHALQPEGSAAILAFCARQLVTLYPGYPERGEPRLPHFLFLAS